MEMPAKPPEASACEVVSVPWMEPRRDLSSLTGAVCPNKGIVASRKMHAPTAFRGQRLAQLRLGPCNGSEWTTLSISVRNRVMGFACSMESSQFSVGVAHRARELV